MVIIGLSPMVHESAVGIVVSNRLVAAAAEERFTRVKKLGGFPTQGARIRKVVAHPSFYRILQYYTISSPAFPA